MGKNLIVDQYLKKKAHPMNNEIQRVREIILNAHKDIEETIKWNSPTFIYKGNMASYFMNAKKHVSLMFHYGASLPNKSKLLEGDGKIARSVKFLDMEDIERKKKALESIVKEWVALRDKQ